MKNNPEPSLTDKQRANRTYYAKHAEKIKGQKQDAYQKTIAEKEIPARKKLNTRYINPDKPRTTDTDREKLKIRRQIEDWKLAKQLEIDHF